MFLSVSHRSAGFGAPVVIPYHLLSTAGGDASLASPHATAIEMTLLSPIRLRGPQRDLDGHRAARARIERHEAVWMALGLGRGAGSAGMRLNGDGRLIEGREVDDVTD